MVSTKWLAMIGCTVLMASAQAADTTYSYAGATLTDRPGTFGFDPYGADLVGSATFDSSVVTATFSGEAQSLAATLGSGSFGGPAFASLGGSAEPSFDFVDGQIVGWSLAVLFIMPATAYRVPITSSSVLGDDIAPMNGGLILGSASTSHIGAWEREGALAVPETSTSLLMLAGLGICAAVASRRRIR